MVNACYDNPSRQMNKSRSVVDPSQQAIGDEGWAGMQMMALGVQERLGYSLDVRASSIGHRDAGDGLWLQGHASVGSLIALYPGIVYTPLHYRQAAPVAQPSAMCDVSLLLAK